MVINLTSNKYLKVVKWLTKLSHVVLCYPANKWQRKTLAINKMLANIIIMHAHL